MTNLEHYTFSLNLGRIKLRFPKARRILERAVVLYAGWESDNEICSVEMEDGSKMIVGTDHGDVCEVHLESVEQSIKDYETVAAQTRAVLSSLAR